MILRPATKRTVKYDLFGILSDSPSVRETVLRKNRLWFDCPTEIFEKAVGLIVTTEDARQRIEEKCSTVAQFERRDLL